ncbi:uncharacterized protein LOC131687808 [Topomyia yanbarensis]|uniref:uncharacterized protein LOC131687808 n=1 Tax=Topomyia yanbarensis TaxID=2498891 RepID=UPI00273C238F|nr:uncharacterized protein LOC131687808 [Topomyia yanbarensis]
MPLRLINSTIGTATYNAAKFLSSILNGIVGKTDHHIVNSFEFVGDIRQHIVTNECALFSLDVVSLFTNVPVDYAIESVRLRWGELEEHTKIPESSFIAMLELVLTSTFFMHQDRFFKQKFGLPMGSPLSPVVANIVLERVERSALELLHQEGIVPIFFRRYVDDCLSSVRRVQVERMLEVFNSFHPRLQFTIELEEDGQIRFLDTIVRREEDHLTTEWTPKDSEGRYLDYNSSSPFNHKKNSAIALVDRTLKLSEVYYRSNALEVVKQILTNNNYPGSFCNKIIKERTHKLYNTLEPKNTDVTMKFVSAPYIPGLGEKMARYLSQHNIKLAFKTIDKIKDTVHSLSLRTE